MLFWSGMTVVQLSFANEGNTKKPPLKEVIVDLRKGLDLGRAITDVVVDFLADLWKIRAN
jgi:hypothetical protein